jgi:hypothetical protein
MTKRELLLGMSAVPCVLTAGMIFNLFEDAGTLNMVKFTFNRHTSYRWVPAEPHVLKDVVWTEI